MEPTGGIINLGNTCYLNSALRCLANIKPVFEYLVNTSKNDGTMAKELGKVFRELKGNQRVRPVDLLRVIGAHVDIDIRQQNDITEFIMLFFDKLFKEVGCNVEGIMMGVIKRTEYSKSTFDSLRKKMDLDWCKKIAREYSPLQMLFSGQQICQICCCDCKKIWHNYELYQDIQLAIDDDRCNSIIGCLDAHMEDQKLEDWTCDACKGGKGSTRAIAFWRNPTVLMIVLKRFGARLQKNNKRVEVPEYIDIAKYTLGKTKTTYRLNSAAFHSGSYYGGHYHAVIRHANGKWYLCDDDVTVAAGAAAASGMPDVSGAYVYFYEEHDGASSPR